MTEIYIGRKNTKKGEKKVAKGRGSICYQSTHIAKTPKLV
jgi:hypothetical protein